MSLIIDFFFIFIFQEVIVYTQMNDYSRKPPFLLACHHRDKLCASIGACVCAWPVGRSVVARKHRRRDVMCVCVREYRALAAIVVDIN